jgi:hypothetical protein
MKAMFSSLISSMSDENLPIIVLSFEILLVSINEFQFLGWEQITTSEYFNKAFLTFVTLASSSEVPSVVLSILIGFHETLIF